jgi:CheY-like chemotaxis protein
VSSTATFARRHALDNVVHHPSTATLAHPTILIVEDEPMVRSMLADFLRESGLGVLEAGNADEAMTLLQTNPHIDAVFTDVQMPGTMDGLDLARWISRERPSIKVLVTSGKVTRSAAQDWPIIGKPYDAAWVERRLRDAVETT